MSVLDTMKAATAARRQVTLCLDGALQAQHDERQKALVQASFDDHRDNPKLPADKSGPKALAVADEMDTLRTRMAASEVAFTFERLDWKRRLTLQADHPPRDGNVRDAMEGANLERYMPALIRESCVEVKGNDGEPETDIPGEVWDAVLSQLQVGQLETLFQAAKNANDMATTVPISARAFLTSPDSGASLMSQEPGTSARNGSKGGSRPSRRKSSATTKAASPKL
jgi:hypothetical protein